MQPLRRTWPGRRIRRTASRPKTPFLVTPGSEQVRETIERDGLMATLEEIGGEGARQRLRPVHRPVEARTTSTAGRAELDRHLVQPQLPGRNDGNADDAVVHRRSPEIVTALAIAGSLDFDPLTDTLPGADGKPFKLRRRPSGDELPAEGLRAGRGRASGARRRRRQREVDVSPTSERLQLLAALRRAGTARTSPSCRSWSRPRARCTTDHISPAGPWLASAATSTTSATTCSSARSTPSPARPARA